MLNIENENNSFSLEELSKLLGKKWIAQIVLMLGERPFRYGELLSILNGCSKKMLSQQLNLLMENKIIKNHKVCYDNKVKSSYSITEKGKKLLPILREMYVWGDRYLTSKKE